MPVGLPNGVKVTQEGTRVTVEGPRGRLSREFHPDMGINIDEARVVVTRPSDDRQSKALHGLTRALLNNMVIGVSDGFQKRLVINGVGYRAEQQGKDLSLLVGFSHPVPVKAPVAAIVMTSPERLIVYVSDSVPDAFASVCHSESASSSSAGPDSVSETGPPPASASWIVCVASNSPAVPLL